MTERAPDPSAGVDKPLAPDADAADGVAGSAAVAAAAADSSATLCTKASLLRIAFAPDSIASYEGASAEGPSVALRLPNEKS